jgi:outer membrane protein assembly factor BamB
MITTINYIIIAMLVLLTGCGVSDKPKDKCFEDSDCLDSRRCFENNCHDICQTQEDCPPSLQCASNNLCIEWCHLGDIYCQDDNLHNCNAETKSVGISTCYYGCNAEKKECYQPGDLLWRYQIGALIKSSPAIGQDGTIYFAAQDKYLYALGKDGNLKWRSGLDDQIASSPALAQDGTIYFGSFDKKFYALNPDGTIKWVYEITDAFSSPPAIALDGTIYIGTNVGFLHAVSPDGDYKWSTSLSKFTVQNPPTADRDGTVYITVRDIDMMGIHSQLMAIDDRGIKKWEFEFGSDYSCNLNLAAAIGTDGTIYIPCEDSLFAINQDGSEKWKYKYSMEFHSSPSIALDGTIYLGTTNLLGTNILLAINHDGKDHRWYSTTDDRIQSTPAIDDQGNIYFGCDDSFLHALHPDGSAYWKYETGSQVTSSPTIGQDGTIYFGSNDGYVYAIVGGSPLSKDAPWPKHRADLANTGRQD